MKEETKARADEEGYTRVEKPRVAAGWQRPRVQSPKRFEGPIHNCGLCKEKHWVQECTQFKAKTTDERVEYCEKKNLCIRCLRWPHRIEECRYVGKCMVCEKPHHTMVHGAAKLELWEKQKPQSGVTN